MTAVALNVTVTQPTKGGYATAYPDGGSLPQTSNINFMVGQTLANTVIVAVGADGYVDLANQSPGATHFVADLEGYYSPDASSGFQVIAPTRLLDTRKTTPIAAGTSIRLYLGSYKQISAAVLNLTVVAATGGGYITASPDLGGTPTTSNVNYQPHQIIPNEAIVQIGQDGYIDFSNHGTGTANLVVDLSGYFTTGSGEPFTPITPTRYLDTREGGGPGVYPYTSTPVWVGGCPTAPCGFTPLAVAANVTVDEPGAGGYIIAYPSDLTTIPTPSALNFVTGQLTQNAVTVKLSSQETVFSLYNASPGNVQLIADVAGYYGGS